MLSKTKGNIAEAKAVLYFTEYEYRVYIPLGATKDVDLIVEKNNKLYRVQVKYAGLYNGDKTCTAALRVMGGNQSFYTAKKYSDDAFDLLFVYSAKNECYLIPWKKVIARTAIKVEALLYQIYKI